MLRVEGQRFRRRSKSACYYRDAAKLNPPAVGVVVTNEGAEVLATSPTGHTVALFNAPNRSSSPVRGSMYELGLNGISGLKLTGLADPLLQSFTIEVVLWTNTSTLNHRIFAATKVDSGTESCYATIQTTTGQVALLLRGEGSATLFSCITNAAVKGRGRVLLHFRVDRETALIDIWVNGVLASSQASIATLLPLRFLNGEMSVGCTLIGAAGLVGGAGDFYILPSSLSKAQMRDRLRLAMGSVYVDVIKQLAAAHYFDTDPDMVTTDLARGPIEVLANTTASDWSEGNYGTISDDPSGGVRVTKGPSSAFPYGAIDRLVTGKPYRAVGSIERFGSTAGYPSLYCPSGTIWQGDAADGAQVFDFAFVATNEQLRFYGYGLSVGTGGVILHSLTVAELSPIVLTTAASVVDAPMGCGVAWALQGSGANTIGYVAHADIDIDFDADFTVVSFIKIGSPLTKGFFGKAATNSAVGLELFTVTPGTAVYFRVNGSSLALVVPDIFDGAWKMVAARFAGTTRTLQVYSSSGMLEASSTLLGSRANNQPIYVGSNAVVGGAHWPGALVPPMIFNRSLPDDDIQSIWARFADGDL